MDLYICFSLIYRSGSIIETISRKLGKELGNMRIASHESTSNRTSISIHAYATLTRAQFAHPRPRVTPGVCILLCSFYYFSSSLVTREKVQGDTFSRAIKLEGDQARLNGRYLRSKFHSWSIIEITSRISHHSQVKNNSIILIVSIIVTLLLQFFF